MTRKDGINSGHLASQDTEPVPIDLRVREQLLFNGLTEMTVKFETPEARHARELMETQNRLHEHRMEFTRLALAAMILIGFLGLSIYLLAFKPDATEKEQLLALTATVVYGGAAYAFRIRPNKPG